MSSGLDDATRLAAVAECGTIEGVSRPHLDRITDLASDMLSVPISLVSLVDDSRQVFASAVGLGGLRETPLSHSFCRFVVLSGEPLVVADALEDPELREHPAVHDLGVRAYCGVPIRSPEGLVLGALAAIDGERHEWTSHDVDTLTAFAGVVSSELHTDARFRSLTRDLHRRLLPSGLADSPRWDLGVGYRPLAADVGLGGDFYDTIPCADGSLVLVVGDIVGHDVSASIAMGQLRAAVTGLVHGGAELPDLVGALDRSADTMPGVFCSAVVVVRVDPSGTSARYLTAGSIPPLLGRADGTVEFLTGALAPPVGVPAERHEATVALAPGDCLVLCSDGLVEGRRTGIDPGMKRVADIVSLRGATTASALADRLLEDRLAQGRQDDDLTVLVWMPTAHDADGGATMGG